MSPAWRRWHRIQARSPRYLRRLLPSRLLRDQRRWLDATVWLLLSLLPPSEKWWWRGGSTRRRSPESPADTRANLLESGPYRSRADGSQTPHPRLASCRGLGYQTGHSSDLVS